MIKELLLSLTEAEDGQVHADINVAAITDYLKRTGKQGRDDILKVLANTIRNTDNIYKDLDK
jgi:hypothetical protein